METNNEQQINTFSRINLNKGKGSEKKLMWFAFGCLTSIILIMGVTFFSIIGLVSMSRKPSVKIAQNSILRISISGSIEEHRELDQDIFFLSSSHSATDLIRKIDAAAKDPNISGLLLEPKFISVSYPVLNEICDAIANFRGKGKTVYAYLEMASNRDYYLAASADKIYLNPSASSGIYLSGIAISSLYMKDLLDKLGVEMTVIHIGDYKGAGEEYVRNTMSPEMIESISLLLDDIYEQIIFDLAQKRGLSFNSIKSIFEERDDVFINGDYALESRIVDELAYHRDILDLLKDYGHETVGLSKYPVTVYKNKVPEKIAVVYLNGNIAPATGKIQDTNLSAAKVKSIFEKIEKDSNIKAVVLRIDSPGGSALESDIIYRYISQLKETKPVLVSMGGAAASGGYYISAPADYIFADPYTITGSIGVVGMIPNFAGLSEKIGTTSQSIERGKYSNFFNLWEKPKKSDIDALKRSMNETYQEFLTRVVDGRGIDRQELELIAEGRIWSGKRAVSLGLVDEMGSLLNTVEKASEYAGIQEYNTVVYPKTRTLLDVFLESRFDLPAISIFHKSFVEDEIKNLQKLYDTVKNAPVQMLAPVLELE